MRLFEFWKIFWIKNLTNPRKRTTIRISINYCCKPGKCEPAFVGLTDLQNPPHKWHGFRSITHNPEVLSSNTLTGTRLSPATKKTPEMVFFLSVLKNCAGRLSLPVVTCKSKAVRFGCSKEIPVIIETGLQKRTSNGEIDHRQIWLRNGRTP